MSISSFFQRLDAPLANNRWSWGSQRLSDGAVFLRVWQDLKFVEDGQAYMLVDARTHDDTDSLGYHERVRHLQSVRDGAPCFLVMCVAKDVEASPRTIKEFNDLEVFVGGGIVDTPVDFVFPRQTSPHVLPFCEDGATWVRLSGRRPIRDLTPDLTKHI